MSVPNNTNPQIKNSLIKRGDEKERSSLAANKIARVRLPKKINQNKGINNAKIKVADEEIRIIMGLFYYTISSLGYTRVATYMLNS